MRALLSVLVVSFLVGWGCGRGDGQPLQPMTLDSTVDRERATTGDLVHFEIRASWDAAFEVEVDVPELPLEDLPLVDTAHGEPVLAGGRYEQIWSYRLRADRVGSYILPAARARYVPIRQMADDSLPSPAGTPQERFVESRALTVEVESVLSVEADASDIRDIKPLRKVRESDRWPIWVGLAALAIVLALAWWVWRRKRPTETASPLPADVVALRALQALEGADAGTLEALRQYYFEISVILRTYVESRFGLNATDLTTEEILGNLGRLDLQREAGGVLQRFLVDSDLVKFAAHVPTREEIGRTWDRAIRFVESTRQEEEAGASG